MKDYEHVVVWLDYFNNMLTKAKGRKLGKNKCVSDPSLKELQNATTSAGFEIVETNESARHPKRPYVKSGYITVPKKVPKSKILNAISKNLVEKRVKNK